MAMRPSTQIHTYEIDPMPADEVRTRFKDSMTVNATVITETAWMAAINFRVRDKVKDYFHARVVESFGKTLDIEHDSRTIIRSGKHGLLTVHYLTERFYGHTRVSVDPERSWGAGRKLPSREFSFTALITKAVLADFAAGKVAVLEVRGPWDNAWQAIQKATEGRQAQVTAEVKATADVATERALRDAAEAPVLAAWQRVAPGGDAYQSRAYNARTNTRGHGGTYTFTISMGEGSRPLGPTLAAELTHRMGLMGNAQVELTVSNLSADQATYLLEALPQAE